MAPVKKQRHLTVISKAAAPAGPGLVTAPDDLRPEELNLAGQYNEAAGISGVLAGVIRGEQEWDLRPLVLKTGELYLIRQGNPEWLLDPAKKELFSSLYTRIADSKTGKALNLSHSFKHGVIWSARRYLKATLDSPEAFSSLPYHPVQICQKIIGAVAELHSHNIAHGHISPANIAFDDGEVIIIDFGYAFLEGRSGLAPEAALGGDIPRTADIFGLGCVIKTLLGDSVTPRHAGFIERMIASRPRLRPSIEETAAVFGVERKKGAEMPRAVITNAKSGSGRKISTGQVISGKALSLPKINSLSAGLVVGKNSADAVTQSEAVKSRPPHEKKEIPKDLVTAVRRNLYGNNFNGVMEKREQKQQRSAAGASLTSGVKRFDFDLLSGSGVSSPAQQNISVPPPEKYLNTSGKKLKDNLFLLALVLIIVAGYVYKFDLVGQYTDKASVTAVISEIWDPIDYKAYWSSGQPSLLKETARAALRPWSSRSAQAAIIGSVFSRTSPPGVKQKLLRTVFDPKWESSLGAKDRKIALTLALEKLYPEGVADLPKLSEAHPAVILGVAAELPVNSKVRGLESISIDKMSNLPSPYGALFGELGRRGVNDMGDLHARALGKILTGDVGEEVLRAFMGRSVEKFLPVLFPLLKHSGRSGFAALLYSLLEKDSGLAGARTAWFKQGKTGEWSKVEPYPKIVLSTNNWPEYSFTTEQYADLLLFPGKAVQKRAVLFFKKNQKPWLGEIAGFIAGQGNGLSRFQSVYIIAALALNDDTAGPAISAWFKFKDRPHPESVLRMLLIMGGTGAPSSFTFEAARYLAASGVEIGFKDLKLLARHPEPMARALAYSKLNPYKIKEFKMLKEMSEIEPDAALAKQIVEKLELAVKTVDLAD